MHTVLATMDGQTLLLAQPDITPAPPATGTGETGTATTGEAGDPNAGDQTPKQSPGLFDSPMFLILIVGMMVLWIFMLGGGSRKQKKKQQQMLASMSKGSKVVSIGGIKGSVVEVRDDEVVVKVDENNNTRMKFTKDAIRTVLDESADKDSK